MSILTSNIYSISCVNDGSDGDSIQKVTAYYSVSTNNTTAPTNSADWGTTPPNRSSNQYLWRKDLITYISGKEEYTTPYIVNGYDGDSSYAFIRYSSKESPHDDMYEVPKSDTLYMGTYVSKVNSPSTTYSDYTWVKIKGDNALHVKIEAINGTEFSNDGKSISLKATGYNGGTVITGSYKWYKDGTIISGATSATYSISCTGLSLITVFKCTMTYNNIEVSDSITIKNSPSVLYGDTNPYLGDSTIYTGSIWIDTSTDPATYYRYNGNSWDSITEAQYYSYIGYGNGRTTKFFTTKIHETANEIISLASRVSINETNISESYSEAKQTADKISWIVESGDSATNFILTDRVATLIANYINLNGLVTFSALAPETVSLINGSVKVGSRNYIRNSKTMIYDSYGASDETSVIITHLVDENGNYLVDENDNYLID